MAIVFYKNGKTRQVKNLGWLLKHASEVKSIEVHPQSHYVITANGYESRMIATLDDGTFYITDWGSLTVCEEWLKARQCFKNTTVKFYS